ncbi:MAG: XTP/dITP diphosphatase [Candidatus Gastranaerophilaceae bacterium]|jgi:XTP/dITP diphosphohydrolase
MVELKKLVLATGNQNKVNEIKAKLQEQKLSIEIIQVKQPFDVEETGKTFSENAYIKAFTAAKIMNLPTLADDSGLCIDALNGDPGIYSSRYEETTEKRIEKVLKNLKNVPPQKRTAHFICALAVVSPEGDLLFSTEGKCEGIIIDETKGDLGFGYDPIFYIPDLNKTMAELSMDEKNKVSHRSDALNKFVLWLGELK